MKLFLLIFIFILSCTSNKSIQRRDLDHLYIGGTQEKYFLADLPTWANFSSLGKCRISSNVKYLNFSNLYRSYGLSYEKIVQFQYMFNKKISEFKKNSKSSDIILQDEAFIFFNTQEKILGGAKQFLKPNFKKINIFWIDPALSNLDIKKKLIKKLKSEEGQNGYPLFLSRCLDHSGLQKFVKSNNLDDLGIKFLPSSMFSPYNSFMVLGYGFELNLMKILKGKELTFFGPSLPSFIKGNIQFRNY